ncbi:putative LPS assembly protein LptD [uncultured Microscilla sp.]|uniref:putative LPS assembly protein LptD n=1 Tax=uncultured Microscilla sp. TaxID=432653 RepID=UPI002611BB04|nr:putative LPS assembly protein LptD [uncultured Microscilla sp.]
MPKFWGVWIMLVVMFASQAVQGQITTKDSLKKNTRVDIERSDTTKIRDSTEVRLGDSTRKNNTQRPPKGDITTTIKYDARDSIMMDVTGKIMYLYGEAKVDYGATKLTAAFIEINMKTNLITAKAIKDDSTGKVIGRPVFKDDAGSYEADSMVYNYKTRKGIINRVVTKQGEGYIILEKAKKNEKNETFGLNGKYTTCNLANPHFHIQSYKLKLVPEKQIVTGPFNLYIKDSPTPLGFLFGIFPFTSRNTSGIIIPTYGEERERGFFLRQGGYYWAVNPYIGITFLTDFYTNGSWGATMNTEYKKRYRFNGSASLAFNKNITGDLNRAVSEDFWVTWNHSPVPRGSARFSASVRAGSSRYNANNTFQTENRLSNTFNSSISYSNTFNVGEIPFNLGVNLRHDQNVQTEIMNMSLPEINLQMNRVYPFKKKGKAAKNPIQNLSFSYTASATNRLTNQAPSPGAFTSPNGLDTAKVDFNFANWAVISRRGSMGIKHTIPVSTTMKLFKHLSLNPTFSYEEWWYPKKLNYDDSNPDAVVIDTLNGFSRASSYNASISLNTRIYGTYQNIRFLSKKVVGIRHIMNPSVSFSYRPDFSEARYDYFQNVRTTSNPEGTLISRYNGAGFVQGAPAGGKSAVMGFSLSNTVEMKVKDDKDTTNAEGTKKIKLLENLSFASGYNFLADSFNLTRVSITARTRLLGFIDLNSTATYDPYTWELVSNEGGNIIQRQRDVYAWSRDLSITNPQIRGQINQASIALSANFTPESFRRKRQKKMNQLNNARENSELTQRQIMNDPNAYVDFEIPWRLNMSFNMSYSKQGFQKSVVTRNLNFNGDISLSKTWKISATSGYDFDAKTLSYTSLNVYKDLHCWEMSFGWIPFGQFQSFTFDLKVKAAILQDLKLSRRRTWFDN